MVGVDLQDVATVRIFVAKPNPDISFEAWVRTDHASCGYSVRGVLDHVGLDVVLSKNLIDAVRRADGIVRLIRLDPKNLQSRTIRLQVDATRPGRRLGLV